MEQARKNAPKRPKRPKRRQYDAAFAQLPTAKQREVLALVYAFLFRGQRPDEKGQFGDVRR